MPLVDTLLPEVDREMGITRQLLARVPDAALDWKPHPRASSLAHLATHLATLPRWGTMTIAARALDIDSTPPQAPLTSRAAILAAFDAEASAFRTALAASSDHDLQEPWTLARGSAPVFSMPRAAVLRAFVMNHLIHHRGQLSVYLRQLDVALPSIYGPSADEVAFR